MSDKILRTIEEQNDVTQIPLARSFKMSHLKMRLVSNLPLDGTAFINLAEYSRL